MKNFFVIILITLSAAVYGQGMKINWEDEDGREFSISAPSGQFNYGMLNGDYVSYNLSGRVAQVGPVLISYNLSGKVSSIGSVLINYDLSGRVRSVGNLYVSYDMQGRVTGTSGSVD